MRSSPGILLVEDDVNIATGLKKVMQREGYDVTSLVPGDEGLAAALAGLFDVVITDLKLPAWTACSWFASCTKRNLPPPITSSPTAQTHAPAGLRNATGVTRLKMREKLKEFGLYARDDSPDS